MLNPARKLRLLSLPLAALFTLVCLHGAVARAAANPGNNCAEAQKIIEEAESLRAEWKIDALREAIKKYETARACWQAAGEPAREADALKEAGDVYFILSDYAHARESYDETLKLRKSTGERQKEAEAANDLGAVYTYLGDYEKANENIRYALALSRETGDRTVEARALNSTGFVSYMQADLTQALAQFAQAQTIAESLPDHLPLAEVLLNIGYARNDIGELEVALKFYEQALPLWQEAHHQRGVARTLSAIGGAYVALGESEKAREHHQQALQIAREMGDVEGQAIILTGLGYTYESLGDLERARDLYLQALENFRGAGNVAGEAQSSQYVGDIYRQLGQNEQAHDYYLKCLDISRRIKDRMLEALALNSIGLSAQAMGKTKDALDNFNRAFSIYQSKGNRRAEAMTLDNLGVLFDAQDARPKALSYYEQALPLAQETGDRALEVLTRGHVAQLERDAGHYQEARAQLEASLKIIETLRAKVVSPDLRSSYLASVREHYELYIDVLMQMHKEHPEQKLDVAALKVSEQARARSLLDLLVEGHANIRQGISPELLEQEQSLQRKLDGLAAKQMKLLGGQHFAEDVAALDKEIRDLNGEYEQLETRIREQSPRYAALTQPQPVDIEEVQRRILDDKTLLLEYVLGHERSYLWVIGKAEVSSYELPAGTMIEESARRVYQLLLAYQPAPGETAAQREARVEQTDGQYWSQAAALSKLILEPAARQLADKRLLVVADGALQYVPFGALTIPENGNQNAGAGESNSAADPKPLMLEHEIVNLPSMTTLAVVRREVENRQPSPKAVAVFADPVFEKDDPRVQRAAGADASGDESSQAAELQQALRDIDPTQGKHIPRLLNSRAEAEKIMSLVPGGAGFKALGFEATRTQAMNLDLKQYQIIHFATHGILNSVHPELSGVVLSLMDETGHPQDGFLRLRDIYNLSLPVELVVLSACNTGLGKDVRGEGLVGLTRGFMYAGASSVMASLWKVDDEATSELMGRFYQELLKDGRTPAAALREAQAAMWKQKRWRAPYFWAGFVLQGEYNRSVRVNSDERGKYRAGIMAGALLLVLSAAGFYIFKRTRKGTRAARAAQ
ncbi:MAG TPA: CHAT domain-containing tetratricopeptide repeat protein [Pyrinomonadaceae bacterium]